MEQLSAQSSYWTFDEESAQSSVSVSRTWTLSTILPLPGALKHLEISFLFLRLVGVSFFVSTKGKPSLNQLSAQSSYWTVGEESAQSSVAFSRTWTFSTMLPLPGAFKHLEIRSWRFVSVILHCKTNNLIEGILLC